MRIKCYINALAVRNLRISYTSQSDDHGLGTLGRTLLASSVPDSKKPTSHSSWPRISIQMHPPATEYQPNRNAKSHFSFITPRAPKGEQREETPKAEGGGGWLGILLPRGLGNSRAPCQPAEHPHEKCRFRVGAEAEGQSSGSCTITLGYQPPQQVLEGLRREGAKQAPHSCKIRTGLAPTHPGIPA